MSHAAVVELLRRNMVPDEYVEIRDLWKAHSMAEDARNIEGLIATLTPDCVYELPQTGHQWVGHDGATRFYTELLSAFPDIEFNLTNIVIGPQGVCEEASVVGTQHAAWLNLPPTGKRVNFSVIILFPWDDARKKFKGERMFYYGLDEHDTTGED